MTQLTSPFTEMKYGWNYGESGWNTGMDENLLKTSFLFDKNIDGIVNSLPPVVSGQSWYLSTDKRVYFATGSSYYSTPVPKWFTLILKSTGQAYQFNGTSLEQVNSQAELDQRLDTVENTLATLGSAAYEDISSFATSAELDIVSAQASAYTDQLRSSLASTTGSTLVDASTSLTGGVPVTLKQDIDKRNAYPFQFKLPTDTDDTNSWVKALATGKVVDGLGKNYIISSILEIPSNRMIIRANIQQAGGSVDNMSMIQMTGLGGTIKQNISFIDVHLDGNRQAQTNIGFGASGDGERHGFYVKGQARNILFSRCSADNCATDGLTLFGAAAGITFAIQGVVIDQCSFRQNRRHGVAFDTLYKLRAFGGDWFNNGNNLPGAAGQPITSGYYGARVGDVNGPQYGNGCDIESYGADGAHSTHVEDVEFHGVNMTGNYSGGLKILTMPGANFNGQPGYLNPIWKPMKNIKVFGGVYDEGVNGMPSAETSPIQVGASGLLPANITGCVDFYVYAVNCSSSIAMNNTNRSHFQGSIDSLNGGTFKYHAFIQNCFNINLQLNTPQTLAVYQDGSTVTVNKPLTSNTVPTLTVSGGTISSQTTTLVSSDQQAGQVYRINATGNLTLAVGSNLQLNLIAGSRVINDAHGSYFNTVTKDVRAAFYRTSAGYFLLKPDSQDSIEIVMYITLS